MRSIWVISSRHKHGQAGNSAYALCYRWLLQFWFVGVSYNLWISRVPVLQFFLFCCVLLWLGECFNLFHQTFSPPFNQHKKAIHQERCEAESVCVCRELWSTLGRCNLKLQSIFAVTVKLKFSVEQYEKNFSCEMHSLWVMQTFTDSSEQVLGSALSTAMETVSQHCVQLFLLWRLCCTLLKNWERWW